MLALVEEVVNRLTKENLLRYIWRIFTKNDHAIGMIVFMGFFVHFRKLSLNSTSRQTFDKLFGHA